MIRYFCILGFFAALISTFAQPDPKRVAEIARMLPDKPKGLCAPISDRAAWAKLKQKYGSSIRHAEGIAKAPIPEQPDELFLDFSKTGNRTRWQRVASRRRANIRSLVIGECVENKGRFLPKIEEYIKAYCAERTWVLPAHDRTLRNFHRKQVDIDLGSSMFAWDLATLDYMLGEKLKPEVRALLRKNLNDRIVVPLRDMFSGKRKKNWWLSTTNNWNAVCLACTIGTVLAQVESREDRAFFAAGAEEHIKNFLSGFTADGYCSEGVGYWNYGFGHFILLTETLYQNTGGKLDLLQMKGARAPALFGARIGIINGIYPAFADCHINSRPSSAILRYVSLRLGLGLRDYDSLKPSMPTGSLYGQMLVALGDSASKMKPAQTPMEMDALRSWFPDAGILVGRPGGIKTCKMAVALKGGHNAEHHNHNDVGSYLIVVGRRVPVIDPGSEVYTARTFSSRRYESNVLNSFGHSVPRIAGKLQEKGKASRGEIVSTSFTDVEDSVEIEMKSAYRAPTLKSLRRKFTYSREGEGRFTVQDTVAFSEPGTFENAIITFGRWKQIDKRKLLVYDLEGAVEVSITTRPNLDLTFTETKLTEDVSAHRTPTRIGIAFPQPVVNASLTLTYRSTRSPVSPPEGELLANGGFENGNLFWRIKDGGMGSIVKEQKKSGAQSLKIVDSTKSNGSNIFSAGMAAEGGKSYVLSGQALTTSGEGLGVYLYFYDKNGLRLNQVDANGNMAAVLTIGDTGKVWKPFEVKVTAPEKTAEVTLWLHTFNAAVTTVYLDDLRLKVEKRTVSRNQQK